MLNRSGIFSEWIREYCSPVVLTITTAEVENICYKNGVLFHELLGAFGHLDSVNAVIRLPGSPNIVINDAHIRFERSSEARFKSSNVIEELLKLSFDPCNIDSLPSSIPELKGSPPSSWNHKIEQILLMRSLSFSEYEMLSTPMVIIIAVASTEADPYLAMQELLSYHHKPQCFLNGQYDTDVHYIYLVVHDVAEGKEIDTGAILRRMQSKYPPSQTKLLSINSLSKDQLNLQQPDLWTKCCIPLCFQQSIPPVEGLKPIPTNPANGIPVLGSRLSIEDFMTLREFCFALFHHDIVPALERRILSLTRIVTDARKGVKNVLKSFWRKPREETPQSAPATKSSTGSVRYRYDRIESQILQLADISFIIKDYETAISMYKLVRDDYKADRSNGHLIHTYIMIAVAMALSDPTRVRDVISHLETVSQLLQSPVEPPHIVAYFALVATEIYTSKDYRQYIDAAQLLLLVAGQVSKFPVLCALLSEKAATCFLIGGYSRRYVLYNILAGHKLRSVGGLTGKHAIMNFASALLLHDNGHWGDIKAKLCRAIAQELKFYHSDSQHQYNERSLVASLLTLQSVLTEENNVGGKESIADAAAILQELMAYKLNPVEPMDRTTQSTSILSTSQTMKVSEGWSSLDTHDLLVSTLPIAIYPTSVESSQTASILEIYELPCPEINISKLSLMIPFNGIKSYVPWDGNIPIGSPFITTTNSSSNSTSNIFNTVTTIPSYHMFIQAEEMKCMSDIERSWGLEYQESKSFDSHTAIFPSTSLSTSTSFSTIRSLGIRWVEAEVELHARKHKYINRNYQSFLSLSTLSSYQIGKTGLSSTTSARIAQIPLGEILTLRVQIKNKLPVSLYITNLKIDIEPSVDFDIIPLDVSLSSKEVKDIHLQIRPRVIGIFSIDRLKWNLSDSLCVKRTIRKAGSLLQRTQSQRIERQRAEDKSLKFEVITSYPLLTMIFEGVSEEVLQGQLLKTTLLLRNDGNAIARDIFLKISQPCFVFTALTSSDDSSILNLKGPSLMDIYGQSCTLLRLPDYVMIHPKAEFRLQAWLRLSNTGKQIISVLSTYQAQRDDVNISSSIDMNTSININQKLTEPRSSFVSVQTTVIPSVKLSSHVLANPSLTQIRSMFVELTNVIGSDGNTQSPLSNTRIPSRERNSSVGQIDITSDFESLGLDMLGRDSTDSSDSNNIEEIPLEEGYCQIEGIWILGCANATSISDFQTWKAFMAQPMEKIIIPLKLEITEATTNRKSFDRVVNASNLIVPTNTTPKSKQSMLQLQGLSSWPIPLSSNQPSQGTRRNQNTGPLTAIHLSNLLERFVSMSYAYNLFRKDIREAERQYQLSTMDAELPRTITQVRKDRQKGIITSSNSFVDIELDVDTNNVGNNSSKDDYNQNDNSKINSNKDNNKDNDKNSDVNLFSDLQGQSYSSSSSTATTIVVKNRASTGYPTTLLDLALLESQGCNVNLMVVWKCKWQGKIRLGMHNLSNVSLLPQESINEWQKKRKPIPSQDSILVGIYHDKVVQLSKDKNHTSSSDTNHTICQSGIMVPVIVKLRSVSQLYLTVTVEVVDRKDPSKDGSFSGSSHSVKTTTSTQGSTITEDMNISVSKSSSQGFQWCCKTKYSHMELKPFTSITLPFVAHIQHAGIFDLKRLRISVSDGKNSDKIVYKEVIGQSLIQVVDSDYSDEEGK